MKGRRKTVLAAVLLALSVCAAWLLPDMAAALQDGRTFDRAVYREITGAELRVSVTLTEKIRMMQNYSTSMKTDTVVDGDTEEMMRVNARSAMEIILRTPDKDGWQEETETWLYISDDDLAASTMVYEITWQQQGMVWTAGLDMDTGMLLYMRLLFPEGYGESEEAWTDRNEDAFLLASGLLEYWGMFGIVEYYDEAIDYGVLRIGVLPDPAYPAPSSESNDENVDPVPVEVEIRVDGTGLYINCPAGSTEK